jgi:hypothetical protein
MTKPYPLLHATERTTASKSWCVPRLLGAKSETFAAKMWDPFPAHKTHAHAQQRLTTTRAKTRQTKLKIFRALRYLAHPTQRCTRQNSTLDVGRFRRHSNFVIHASNAILSIQTEPVILSKKIENEADGPAK